MSWNFKALADVIATRIDPTKDDFDTSYLRYWHKLLTELPDDTEVIGWVCLTDDDQCHNLHTFALLTPDMDFKNFGMFIDFGLYTAGTYAADPKGKTIRNDDDPRYLAWLGDWGADGFCICGWVQELINVSQSTS